MIKHICDICLKEEAGTTPSVAVEAPGKKLGECYLVITGVVDTFGASPTDRAPKLDVCTDCYDRMLVKICNSRGFTPVRND